MTTRTLAEIADLCGAELQGDPSRAIDGPAPLSEATPRNVSFFTNPRYSRELLATRAGAVIVARDFESPRTDLALLRCREPGSAFSTVVQAFAGSDPAPEAGVHPSAHVDPSARVHPGASVGARCVVGAGAALAEGSILHPGVVLGRGASVGAHTELHPGVVVYAGVSIGARCIVHAGTVLGADGFGFDPAEGGTWAKIPQCGTVEIEDDVEIGANVAIDRGRFGATRIGRGTKIDNLVHVAHNVVIGEHSLLIAQSGIAGSARLGPHAIVGGQAGINGHVEIGKGARIGGGSAVFNDIPPGADFLGWPARPRAEALRSLALSGKLPELLERLRALERRLEREDGSR